MPLRQDKRSSPPPLSNTLPGHARCAIWHGLITNRHQASHSSFRSTQTVDETTPGPARAFVSVFFLGAVRVTSWPLSSLCLVLECPKNGLSLAGCAWPLRHHYVKLWTWKRAFSSCLPARNNHSRVGKDSNQAQRFHWHYKWGNDCRSTAVPSAFFSSLRRPSTLSFDDNDQLNVAWFFGILVRISTYTDHQMADWLEWWRFSPPKKGDGESTLNYSCHKCHPGIIVINDRAKKLIFQYERGWWG